MSLDLETICLKCLEKSPARRYASAESLAEDLRRFIEDRPIQARPVGGVERVERWVRRRPALAAAIAALHLVLVLGLAGIVWQWRRAEGEASRATAATREARNNLVRQYVAKGNEAAGDGRVLEALPWYLAALREEPDPQHQELHRLRLTTGASVAPRPEFVWAASNVVNVVALSPDERWVAAGTDEGFAQVWDLNSGEAVTTPLLHREAVRGLSFHPGGRLLLTFSSLRQTGAFGSAPGGRGSVRLWSVPEGREIVSFIHSNRVGQALFSPDGLWMASACADGRARLWRISDVDGSPRVLPEQEWAHEAEVGSVDFSPDSRQLATASLDGVVNLWDVKGGTLLKRFENRPDSVGWSPEGRNLGTLFSPDGRRLVAYLEYRARAWDIESGRRLYDLEFSNSGLNGLRASTDGETLVSATRNGQVRTWSATNGLPQIMINASASALALALRFGAAPTPDGSWLMVWGEAGLTFREPWSGFVRPLHFPTRRVREATVTRDGRRVVLASAEGGVWIWNLVHAATTGRILEMNDFGHRVRYSPDGRHLVTGDQSSYVGFWDAETGRSLLPKLHAQLPAPWGVYQFATSPDGRQVLACDEGGGMRLYRFDTGMPMGPLWTNTMVGPSAAVFLPGGRQIVVADRGGVLRRLQIPEGIVERSITNAGAHAFRGLVATPDGREVITLSVDETARRWNSETLEPVGEPMDLGGPGEHGAITPDGRLLITTCSSRGEPRVWELASGRLLHRLAQPVGQWEAYLLAINAAGTQIATMAEGGTARLWNPRTGKLDRLVHYDGRVQALTFSPDGQRLGVGGDRGARIWDLTTGEPLSPMFQMDDRQLGANQLTFSPDGTHLAAAGGGSRARVWDLRPAPWTLADWEAYVGALCGAKVEADGRLASLSAPDATALRATVRKSFPHEFSPTPEQNSEFLWMQARDHPTLAGWKGLLAHLDLAVASDPPDQPDLGFSRYRHMRAIARVQVGDLAGAAEDKPEVAIPGRDPACTPRQVNLSKMYNRGLGLWGWSTSPNNYFAGLPIGKQVLGGIAFDLRGALKLDGNHPYHGLYPQRIEGIAVESMCRTMCVLQATDFDATDGTRVGEFVLHYADGDTRRLPMVYGEDLRNWWTVANESTNTPNAEVVWRGTNPSATAEGQTIRLFLRRYANPRPEVMLRSVDVVSTMGAAGPFVLAMTLE